MNPHQHTIEKARPYLPGLPPDIRLVPWDQVPHRPGDLGYAFRTEAAIALHPKLQGEALEAVLLHELLHLAEPRLSEDWVRALEPILQTAIRLGLPPRDVPSLAWVSTEELAERLLPGLRTEGVDPDFFPGRLGAFWHTLGVIPTKTLEDDPLYVFQQIAGGLPFRTTLWVLERVWTPPPMTRREAALAVAWRAALALGEEWRKVEELLGRDELMPSRLEFADPQVWYIPIPQERRQTTMSLLDAILDDRGEAYTPPEAGLPEEVVAGMLATGRP